MSDGKVFGASYADAYDVIYADKDYVGEVQTVLGIYARHRSEPALQVVDVGCGSGRHAVEFARAGAQVLGVDASAAMLEKARQRLAHLPPSLASRITLVQGDAGTGVPAPAGQADVVVMMFAVMGYLTTNTQLRTCLQSIRQGLKPGGLFIFDVWHGPAVLSEGPSDRVAQWPLPSGGVLLRAAKSTIHPRLHTCDVSYQLHQVENGQHRSWTEVHTMRFFFEQELRWMLEDAGMALVAFSPFPETDKDLTLSTWNAVGVSRAL